MLFPLHSDKHCDVIYHYAHTTRFEPLLLGLLPGMWKRKRWKRSFSVEAEAEARKIPPLPLPHRGRVEREKKLVLLSFLEERIGEHKH